MKKLFLTLATFVALIAAFFIVANCSNGADLNENLLDHPTNDAATKPSEPSDDNNTSEPSQPENPDEPGGNPDDGKDDPEPPQIFTVIFVADGETVATINYPEGGEIEEPPVPEKEGFTGKWEEYTLVGDITVNAVYERIAYKVGFYIDGALFAECEVYSVEEIVYPEIPSVDFCEIKWEEPAVSGYEIAVNATYVPINYTVSFVADGVTVAEISYNVFDGADEPSVPAKPFYSGVWEEYVLDGGDKTVNAVYSPIVYTVTFVADGKVVGERTYDIENTLFDEPVLAEKPGYEGSWESYSVSGGNITVNAVYMRLNGSEFLTYRAVDGGYKVKKYTGNESRVIVPSEYNGKPVTAIGEEAFAGSSVEEVHLCEGVEKLEYSAFYGCGALKKVLLPESLTELAECAFGWCSSLESISLPSGITVIPAEAFSTSGLKEINLPSNLKEVRERAFYQCGELESVALPDSVESLGDFAFCSCVKLKSVKFGENLKNIGVGAFFGCDALEEAVFADADGWSDDPKQSQNDLPAMLAASPASAASVLKNYANVAFKKEN